MGSFIDFVHTCIFSNNEKFTRNDVHVNESLVHNKTKLYDFKLTLYPTLHTVHSGAKSKQFTLFTVLNVKRQNCCHMIATFLE